MFPVEITFHGDLPAFLRPALRGGPQPVRRDLGEKTSVKDAIEACGIPHTEVDLIARLDRSGAPAAALGFSAHLTAPEKLAVFPVPAPAAVLPAAPRLQDRGCDRFVADGHLGALARHLRLLGIDVAGGHDATDDRLVEIMLAEDRALLTRDRRLLMRSVVRHGYCPRSSDPEEQVREVLRRFPGLDRGAPLSRCLRCNGLLREVPKREVLGPLAGEPRTLLHYHEFFRCRDCGRIYWRGSHFGRLHQRLSRLR